MTAPTYTPGQIARWAESYAFLLPSLLGALCWLAYRGGALS